MNQRGRKLDFLITVVLLHPTMVTSISTTGFNVSLKGDPKVTFETSRPLSHTENATQELHLRIQDRSKVMPT